MCACDCCGCGCLCVGFLVVRNVGGWHAVGVWGNTCAACAWALLWGLCVVLVWWLRIV